MTSTMQIHPFINTNSLLVAPIPGPDRKRTVRSYLFRVTYQTECPEETGCLMTLAVEGGREEYQLALERTEQGSLQWHCTCADAVYRGESEGKTCKHVRGLLSVGRPGQSPAEEGSAKCA